MCTTCAVDLAADQRYCLNCGAANVGAPGPGVHELLAAGVPAAAATAAPERGVPGRLAVLPGREVSLQVAVAVFALVLGMAAWAGARTTSGGPAPAPIAVAAAVPAPAPVATPSATTQPGAAGADVTAVADVPADTQTTVDDSASDAGSEAAPPGDDPSSSTDPSSSGDTTPPGGTDENTADAPAAPPLKHAWVITLADQGYDTLFDPAGQAPYLANDLAAKGTLLSHYYGATTGGLANAVALISGQGPNPSTQADCPSVSDVSPGTVGKDDQAAGSGCLYSTDVFSIADLLTARSQTWRAYAGALDGAAPCPKPVTGAPFPAARVPFLAFHTIIDEPACADHVTGLAALTGDLASSGGTPALSYIVPGPCENGSPAPCAPGTAAGLPPADAFLRRVVEPILASPAYADGGAVVILADQSPQGGPDADTSACCAKRPWQPDPATSGGGRTGALVLSPLAGAGRTINDPVDHYDLLKTLSLAFALRPPGYAERAEVSGLPAATWARWTPPDQG